MVAFTLTDKVVHRCTHNFWILLHSIFILLIFTLAKVVFGEFSSGVWLIVARTLMNRTRQSIHICWIYFFVINTLIVDSGSDPVLSLLGDFRVKSVCCSKNILIFKRQFHIMLLNVKLNCFYK